MDAGMAVAQLHIYCWATLPLTLTLLIIMRPQSNAEALVRFTRV